MLESGQRHIDDALDGGASEAARLMAHGHPQERLRPARVAPIVTFPWRSLKNSQQVQQLARYVC